MKKIEICGYAVNIDYSQDLYSQNILEETKVILSILYRDYLCDEKERNEIIESDIKQLEQDQKELEEKYKIKWNKPEETTETKELIVVEKKEPLYKKIIAFFKRFFKNKDNF